MNFVSKWSVWIPYYLPPQNAQGRVGVAEILLEMEKIGSFLDGLVTSDEKWIFSLTQSKRKVWMT